MSLDWTVSPCLIWCGLILLIAAVAAAVLIEAADWTDNHHDFVVRHTPHWFDDKEV